MLSKSEIVSYLNLIVFFGGLVQCSYGQGDTGMLFKSEIVFYLNLMVFFGGLVHCSYG